MNTLDFKKIKLIIWDLDECFWKGTLSEGEVRIPEENKKLILDLTKRGIVNSICSKNDLDVVKKKLREEKILSNFVFISVNWERKGERVKTIISRANLREENVLFIDDNPHNLGEVADACPKIMCADETIISQLIDNVSTLGKCDNNLSRLQAYKLLEKKNKDKENFNSETDFLEKSNIKIIIEKNILSDFDRIYELVFRTNQLNYTKEKPSKEDFLKQLQNKNYECAEIKCWDNYGDYGIIGFYCLDKQSNRLIHFLFSCRTLGMHIEQYIYQSLNYPQIEIKPPITVNLLPHSEIRYIKTITKNQKDVMTSNGRVKNKKKLLMLGPCDLESVVYYLEKNKFDIDTEFRYINKNGDLVSYGSHAIVLNNILSGINYTETPFFDSEVSQSKIFSNGYDVVVYSLLVNIFLGEYENRDTGERIVFGEWAYDATTDEGRQAFLTKKAFASYPKLTEEDFRIFTEKYKYIGRVSEEETCQRIVKIIEAIPQKTEIIVILGSETAYKGNDARSLADADKYSVKLNALICDRVKKYKNVYLINPTQFIKNNADYSNSIQHYSRRVYYNIAKSILAVTGGVMVFKIKNILQKSKNLLSHIKAKVKKVLVKSK